MSTKDAGEGSGKRRRSRTPLAGRARLAWTNGANIDCTCSGECKDVSEHGLSIEVAERIPVRTIVRFWVDSAGLEGAGSVRYCITRGIKYRIGIEFIGGLKWTGKPEKSKPRWD